MLIPTTSTRNLRCVLALGFLLPGACMLLSALRANSAEPKFTAEQVKFYEKEVLPVLKEHCYKCHAAGKARGGLRLDSRTALFKGGDLGSAILPDRFEQSPFLKAIHYRDGLEMPPAGKLPPTQVALLERWAKQGAPYSPGKEPITKEMEPKKDTITQEDRSWWAYRSLKATPPPQVKRPGWARNPIDLFVLHKLEEKGLHPSSPADRRTLARRVYFDLTGLPPTPEQVDAFVGDTRPDAYERLVEELLASPGYGEKWGRHWLDLVRFAETNGYERDGIKPLAWRYRDYVIASLNADKPYDRFLTEQLAGDEVDHVTPETLTATGYYRLGIWDDEPADPLQAKYDVLDGIVSTTSQVVLGMSIGCARCHEHKKDPIPQRDYYRFLAFFHDLTDMNGRNTRRVVSPSDRQTREEELARKQRLEGQLYQRIHATEQRFLASLARDARLDLSRTIGSDLIDVTYRFYRNTWDALPDFEAVKAEESGEVASNFFSLSPASRNEAIGLVFEGKLKVPVSGEYRFSSESTDGLRLLVAGKSVINRPGKGRQEGTGTAKLEPGLVPIRLEYFNTYSRPVLRLQWSGPGFTNRPLSEDGAERVLVADSRATGQTWAYALQSPGEHWYRPDFDDSAWKKGPGGFGKRGTPGAVVRTTWNGPALYLRRTFEIDKLPGSLALDLHHDDDVKVYLNGNLIYQAKGYLTRYDRIPLDQKALAALRQGRNVLAVYCRQRTGGQYIDVGLVGDGRLNVAGLMTSQGRIVLGAEAFDQYLTDRDRLERLRKQPVAEAGLEIMAVSERGPTQTRLLARGNPHAPGEEVRPAVPEVLRQDSDSLSIARRGDSSGKRLALTGWITDRKNPLPARVMANRLWQYHLGRAISGSSNDLGKLGELPTHPELLDWLALELQRDWSLKRMHRLIVLSATYQQGSRANQEGLVRDPINAYLWRYPMRRLAAEEVRDSMLAVSGELNRRMAGPGVYPLIPREVLAGQSVPGAGWGKSPPEEQARRSVYIHVKRSLIVPILETHDQADTDSSCAVRYTTTVPTQALGMLNGEFPHDQAALLARRVASEKPDDLAAQVRQMIRLATGRHPTQEEITRDITFIQALRKDDKLSVQQSLTMYGLMVLNSNEFIYLD
ncbi:MAG: DUF1549 domain-containing protein [Gemmataceae bacterium]